MSHLHLFALVVLLLAPTAGAFAQDSQRAAVLTTKHFAFHSDFDTNLNDALITTGLARKDAKAGLFTSGDEAACFDKLDPTARAGWNRAVDYYAEIISPVAWNARQQFLLRMHLVGFDERGPDARATEFIGIARAFMSAAAPAYRACRWPAQDALNRGWIEAMRPRLAADEPRVAARLAQLYGKQWPRLPVVVDVVETVNWSGANTSWSDDGQGNVLIARAPAGAAGFETLFHEASHVLMERSFPVQQALAAAAKGAGVRLPGDLWHVVLFYTTGEAVRPIIEGRDGPGYSPMLYEIFRRGTWTEYRDALESAWGPYVEGERTLADAAADLMAALPKP